MPVWVRRGWWCLGIIAFLLAGCASGGGSGTASGTASGTTPMASPTSRVAVVPTPTGTSGPQQPPASLSSLGWKQVGIPRADVVAVAPSAPGTLYTCSVASQGIALSISTDDGTTWHTVNTPTQAGRCVTLRVSPSDPQAVAFYAETCPGDCGASGQVLDYTLDAGAHWTQAISTENGSSPIFDWIGTTLFVNEAPANTPSSRTQYLAASVNGSPFAWTSLPVAPQQIFSNSTTLYVVAGSSATCSSSTGCVDLYQSTNRGATWTHLTPSYNGFNVRPQALMPGSSVLIGYDVRADNGPNTYPILRSTNGGASWQALPGAGANLQAGSDPLLTPNGTIYIYFDSASQGGQYRLAPGASSWALVSAVVPVQVQVTAVSWDASGHPSALWGLGEAPDGSTRTTLWTHAA